jgi:hypothetical protein
VGLVIKTVGKGARGRGRIPPRLIRALAFGQLLVTLPVLVLIIFGVAYVAEFGYQNPPIQGFNIYKTFAKTREALTNFRFPVLRILGYNPEFPDVYVDIKQKNYRKLEFAASHDLTEDTKARFGAGGIRRLIDVPAVLRLDGEAIPVKLRLKGDRKIHYGTPDRWSFRVETKGAHTFFGMRSFSLQRAVARNYIYEWLFHSVLKREGLIGLRYQFITLHVNGKSQGVYAVEEHFRKQLIESNRRRDGPILRFVEEIPANSSDVWTEMPVAPYEAKKWQRSEPESIAYAVTLLEGFRSGRLKFNEVFDVELWGRYFAVCDLFEAFHGAIPKSVKFYLNPVTRRIEPIGFDSHFLDKQYPVLIAEIGDWRDDGGLWGWGTWFQAIFEDDIEENHPLWESYVRNLERLSRPEYLEVLFEEIGDELDANLDFLYTEFPYPDLMTGHPLTGLSPAFYFSPQKLFDRQDFIRARLSPVAGLFAYVERNDTDYLDLNVSNRQKLPLEIVEVTQAGRTYRPAERARLDGRPREVAASSRLIRLFADAESMQLAPASTGPAKKTPDRVVFKVVGATNEVSRRLFDWYAGGPVESSPPPGNASALESRPFLKVDNEKGTVAVRKGEWMIGQDVVIPGGYRLTVGDGTIINLVAGARIVAYGPVVFEGSPDAPIVVRSIDGSGQGLVVIQAGGSSSLRHVVFEGLGVDMTARWKLTSILTFYESDVTIEDTVFCKNASEDALNIIRSRFVLRGVTFSDIHADAFDSDFSDGSIVNTRFINVGNDAIDISGSNVVVEDVAIYNVGDKGLSIGEGSRMEASQVVIAGAYIGAAIKDRSALDATDLTISDASVGFALYQKKPEFGQARTNAWRTQLHNVADDYWVETGSILIFDGAAVTANRTNLKEIIYNGSAVAANETGQEQINTPPIRPLSSWSEMSDCY